MSRAGAFTRRLFFKRTAAAAAAGAWGGVAVTAAAKAGTEPVKIRASSLGKVVSVRRDGSLVVRRRANSRVVEAGPGAASQVPSSLLRQQPQDSAVLLRDPVPAEAWRPGHEVVFLEEITGDEWRIVDLQHLYRNFDDFSVADRAGDELRSADSRECSLVVTGGSQARGSGPLEAVAPSEIEAGDVVAGIGYQDPTGHRISVSQIGVRKRGT